MVTRDEILNIDLKIYFYFCFDGNCSIIAENIFREERNLFSESCYFSLFFFFEYSIINLHIKYIMLFKYFYCRYIDQIVILVKKENKNH